MSEVVPATSEGSIKTNEQFFKDIIEMEEIWRKNEGNNIGSKTTFLFERYLDQGLIVDKSLLTKFRCHYYSVQKKGNSERKFEDEYWSQKLTDALMNKSIVENPTYVTSELVKEYQEATEKVRQLKDEISKKTEENEELERDCFTKEEQLEHIKLTLYRETEEVSKLENEKGVLDGRLDEILKENEKLQARLAEIKNKVESEKSILYYQIGELEKKNNDLAEENDLLEVKILENKLASAKEKLSRAIIRKPLKIFNPD